MKHILTLLLLIPHIVYGSTYVNFSTGRGLDEGNKNKAYAEVLLKQSFRIKKFDNYIYGGWRTWFKTDGLTEGYQPYRDIYTIGYKLKRSIFFVDLKHYCGHAVWSGGDKQEWLNDAKNDKMTVFSIGIELKIN